MEGKEPYSSTSGFSSSYYINIPANRDISLSATAAAAAHLPDLHSFHVPSTAAAAFHPNPMSPLSMQQQHHHHHHHQHSHLFDMDSPSTTHPTVPIPAQGDHLPALIKKKRGRPRKYGPDGKPPNSQLLPSQPSSRSAGSDSTSAATALGSLPEDVDSQKKKRGRPPGTGRKQQLASLGEWFSGSAGTAFTPHVIIVHPEENVVSKIMAFSNQGPRAVSVLSANGSVSTVTLCQSESSGVVTYEGLFEILSLSGSYLLTESDGSRTRSGGLTITLSGPDGRVLGGILGGVLIASTSVQVVLGSFLYGLPKSKMKNKNRDESDIGEKESESTGTLLAQIQHQNLTAVPPTANWPGSRMLDMRTSSIDINLTRG